MLFTFLNFSYYGQGLLLPDLVELYLWLHHALAHLITLERAASISIGRVFQLAAKGHSKEMGEHLTSLYERVKGIIAPFK